MIVQCNCYFDRGHDNPRIYSYSYPTVFPTARATSDLCVDLCSRRGVAGCGHVVCTGALGFQTVQAAVSLTGSFPLRVIFLVG